MVGYKKTLRRVERRARKGRYKNDYSKRQALNSAYRRELKFKQTEAERKFAEFLIEKNVHFEFQKGFLKPFHRIVDFFLTKTRTIIEVDGGYHQKIKSKDDHKDITWLEKRNIKTIRLTNEEVISSDFENKLKDVLVVCNDCEDGKHKSYYYKSKKQNPYFNLSSPIIRKCRRCSESHPIFYKRNKKSGIRMVTICPNSRPATESLPFEVGLPIPII